MTDQKGIKIVCSKEALSLLTWTTLVRGRYPLVGTGLVAAGGRGGSRICSLSGVGSDGLHRAVD